MFYVVACHPTTVFFGHQHKIIVVYFNCVQSVQQPKNKTQFGVNYTRYQLHYLMNQTSDTNYYLKNVLPGNVHLEN